MPPLSSISTTFNDVSYPSSPSVLNHSQGHGDVYPHFQLTTSDRSSHGRLLPQQAYPHSSPAMQSDHSHLQHPSHIHAHNSFWAMNALAAHHSYGQPQPSTSPTSLALLHGNFYDSQHHQALVLAQEQAQAHFPTGGTLPALLQSPLDIQHLSIGNKILPRTTNIPAANAFGGVASAGVSGSLDPETGIFLRTVEHPRLRTAQACEKCRIRKAKVRSLALYLHSNPILTPSHPTPSTVFWRTAQLQTLSLSRTHLRVRPGTEDAWPQQTETPTRSGQSCE